MEEYKEFEALYERIRKFDYDEELGKRYFFNHEIPEYVPVNWLPPFLRPDENGEPSKHYATYRSLSESHLLRLSNEGERSVDAYVDLLRRVYLTLKKRTPYINTNVFIYDVLQVFFSFMEEWDQNKDEMLEFARQVFGSFLVFAPEQTPPNMNSLEGIQAFLEKYEKLFVLSAAKTARRLQEISDREEVAKYIQDDLPGYVARNHPDFEEEPEKLYDFVEVSSQAGNVTQNFSLTLNYLGQRVYPENLMTVFGNMRCWERVPYIVCTDESYKKYFKVYTGKNTEERVPYDRIVLEKKRGYKRFSIEFTLWLGHGTIETTRVGSFFRAVADFDTGKISVKLPVSKTGNYMAEMARIFADFGLDLQVEAVTNAESFSSQTEIAVPIGFVFHEFLFQDILLNNPLFRDSFYCDERIVPVSRRKVMKFYYVPYLTRDFCDQYHQQPATPISWSLTIKTTKSDVQRIRIFISNTTQGPMEHFIEDLLQCLRFYHVGLNHSAEAPRLLQSIKDVYDIYMDTFNNLQEAELDWRVDQVLLVKKEQRKAFLEEGQGAVMTTGAGKTYQHRELSKTFPHVFGPGYAKMCRGKSAPQAFQSESIAMMEAQHMAEQSGIYIPPMPFPLDNPEMWIVMSDPAFPYPTIVKNLDPETQDAYPFVPCASNISSDKDPIYQSIYGDAAALEKDVIKTREHETATDKFLEPGAYGELEPKFRELLQLDDVYTFGVSYPSKNSLLHCVMFARMKSYRDMFVGTGLVSRIKASQEKREAIMKSERAALARTSAVIGKQELYNYTEAEITSMVKDVNLFLDSRLFYRFLEETYNINIFVFSNALGEDKKRFPFLEIPRCSVYHTREMRTDRPSLLLLRNYGPTILLSLNRQPQYEIIRRRNGKMLFDKDVTELCYYLLAETQTVLTWMPSSSGELKLNEGIAFKHNFSALFGDSLISQTIDDAGYTRVITFQHKVGKISMLVPPSQPLGVANTTAYEKTTEKNALLVFKELGKPTGCARNQKMVVGLWFAYLGMEQGIYVPTKRFKGNYDTISLDPFQELSITESVTDSILRTRETANFLKQLIIWVYDIYKKFELVYSWDDFLERYVTYGNDDAPSYDFQNLPEELPGNLNAPEQALAYLANQTEGFIIEDRIYCYNEGLYKKIIYFLSIYDRNKEGLPATPATRIKDYFSLNKFSNQDKHVKIFFNRSEFKEWVDEMLESGGRRPTVVTKCTMDLSKRRLPFVMENKEGYFLVQNVPESNNDPGLARNIAAGWLETGVNNHDYKSEEKYTTVSYVITKSQTTMPRYVSGKYSAREELGDGKPFLRLLLYGNLTEIKEGVSVQAAMLPI